MYFKTLSLLFLCFLGVEVCTAQSMGQLQNKNAVITPYKDQSYVIGQEWGIGKIVERKKKRRDKAYNMVKVVPGLANPDLVSFALLIEPELYLRHQNAQLKWHKSDGTNLFKADATFKIIKGFTGENTVSFVSTNYPTYYISLKNGKELWVVENPNPEDASFLLEVEQ
ncbi:AbfB domain-containing protein [Flammeovirga sp. EKP202]|uniref:AbfB domain-containing protein n=1 Tax=Flammeovirga sp. EKP202 TaxID=2770592 RepID=UPI00165EE284|nr:AbfB domain-containing protein [Flammeovirga sp. EKP202]MBD0402435.1 AbfB domain-containing protein [Flammeovirga sp. EKP202]